MSQQQSLGWSGVCSLPVPCAAQHRCSCRSLQGMRSEELGMPRSCPRTALSVLWQGSQFVAGKEGKSRQTESTGLAVEGLGEAGMLGCQGTACTECVCVTLTVPENEIFTRRLLCPFVSNKCNRVKQVESRDLNRATVTCQLSPLHEGGYGVLGFFFFCPSFQLHAAFTCLELLLLLQILFEKIHFLL